MQQLSDFATTLPAARSSSRRPRSPTCSPNVATESAKRLLGCYRKGEAEDAEIYVAALAVVLEGYPAAVVAHVTDPRTGIPGESKWLPTVADVRHACELAMKPLRDEVDREQRRVASEAAMRGADEERAKRKTLDQLVAAHPGIVGTTMKRPLTQAEKDALMSELYARKAEFTAPLTISPILEAKMKAQPIAQSHTGEGT